MAYFGILLIPLMILAMVMTADYITGLIRAWHTGTISSKTGVLGIIKKFCYLIVVCVGGVIDWLIYTALNQVGVNHKAVFFFGLIIVIWFIINELISILENISEIGVHIPAFLTKIVKKLKTTVENKVESEASGHE